jgi:tRNA A37 N6-isopentenylltransferase MiaA
LSSQTPSEEEFNNAITEMKNSTRRYAKRQVSWLRNKLLPVIWASKASERKAFIYLLDATGELDPILLAEMRLNSSSEPESNWESKVLGLAEQITNCKSFS